MNNHLEIKISGVRGAGKSHVAAKIKQMLESDGYSVSVDDGCHSAKKDLQGRTRPVLIKTVDVNG